MLRISIDSHTIHVENTDGLEYKNITLGSILKQRYNKILPILKLADISNRVYFAINITWSKTVPIPINETAYFASKYLPVHVNTTLFTPTMERMSMLGIKVILIRIFRKENFDKCLKHFRIRNNKKEFTYLDCTFCGKIEDFLNEKFKRCQKCKKVRYCSKECQIQHFEIHKKECGVETQQSVFEVICGEQWKEHKKLGIT